MSSNQRLALAAVAVLLIGTGLYLVQSDDAPVAPSPQAADVPAPPAQPVAVAPPSEPAREVPVVAPVAVAAAVVDAGFVERYDPTAPRPLEEPSPFESGDSAELQYAVKLVIGEGSGPAEWNNAMGVFQRCIDQNKFNHLCRRGLAAAYERLSTDGGPTTLLDPPITIGKDKLEQYNPNNALHPDRPKPAKLR